MSVQRLLRRSTRPLSGAEETQIQQLYDTALAEHQALEPEEGDGPAERQDKRRQQRTLEEQLLRDVDAIIGGNA